MRLVDGIEFVREYRKLNSPYKSIIVILSTLPLKSEQQKELQEMGVYDFVVKPLNTEKLIQLMEQHFSTAEH
jgi:CheY-like chemotaxis protein